MQQFFTAQDMTGAANERFAAGAYPAPLMQPASTNERAVYQRLSAAPGAEWAKDAARQAIDETNAFIASHYTKLSSPTEPRGLPFDLLTYGPRENDDTGFHYNSYKHNVLGCDLQSSHFAWKFAMSAKERQALTALAARRAHTNGFTGVSSKAQEVSSRLLQLPLLNYILRIVQAAYRESTKDANGELWNSVQEVLDSTGLQCAGFSDIVESPQTVPTVTVLPANRAVETLNCVDMIHNGTAEATNVWDRFIECGSDLMFVLKRVKLVWDAAEAAVATEAMTETAESTITTSPGTTSSYTRHGHAMQMQDLFYGTGTDMKTPIDWGIIAAALSARPPSPALVHAVSDIHAPSFDHWWAYQLVPYANRSAGSELPRAVLERGGASGPSATAELDAAVFRPAVSRDRLEDVAFMACDDRTVFSDIDVHRRVMQTTRTNYALGKKMRIVVTHNGFAPEVYCTVAPRAVQQRQLAKKRTRFALHEMYAGVPDAKGLRLRQPKRDAGDDDSAAFDTDNQGLVGWAHRLQHTSNKRAKTQSVERDGDADNRGTIRITRDKVRAASRGDIPVYKIVLVGSVTRENQKKLVTKYTTIAHPTLPDVYTKDIKIDGKDVQLQIWHSQGQEKFLTMGSSYYRDAKGVVLLVNPYNANSIAESWIWAYDIKRYTTDLPVVVCPLAPNAEGSHPSKREIQAIFKSWGEANKPEYQTDKNWNEALPNMIREPIPVSLDMDDNVNELFQTLARAIRDKEDEDR